MELRDASRGLLRVLGGAAGASGGGASASEVLGGGGSGVAADFARIASLNSVVQGVVNRWNADRTSTDADGVARKRYGGVGSARKLNSIDSTHHGLKGVRYQRAWF